jgi:hypothetical protein
MDKVYKRIQSEIQKLLNEIQQLMTNKQSELKLLERKKNALGKQRVFEYLRISDD